jgi:hypothetical protein
MSAVAVLTPVVVAAWPAISAAVTSAAVSLGFTVVDELAGDTGLRQVESSRRTVQLDVPHSEVVTGTLGRDQRIRVARDGVTAEFSRDSRGQAAVCVTGEGLSEEQLRTIGEELSGRMVQHYVLQKLKTEMTSRGMDLVEERIEQNQAIRLRVRHWQN